MFSYFHHNRHGYTLMEILVAIAVLGFSLALTVGFFFSLRHKGLLQQDIDQLTGILEFSRQQSIMAYRGETYGVSITNGNNYLTQVPSGSIRKLNKNTQLFQTPETTQILFHKLSGTVDAVYEIVVSNRGLKGGVNIDAQGLITQNPIQKE